MLDATIILQILWTSLATSSYYVLFAVAFALVLKVTRLFNFAQAAIMTIAFYTAFVAVQWLIWPVWAAFGGVMGRKALRPSLPLNIVFFVVSSALGSSS